MHSTRFKNGVSSTHPGPAGILLTRSQNQYYTEKKHLPMTSTTIITPNNKQHRARSNSWYVLHLLTKKCSNQYKSLNPEVYTKDDGSKRYKVRLPVLLSITSTEDSEIFMDVSNVCKCYNVPYGRCLRIQMFIDGEEAPFVAGHRTIQIDKYKAKANSRYDLYVTEQYADDYERFNPQKIRLANGKTCYKAEIPMLLQTSEAGKESIMDFREVRRHLNISLMYKQIRMYVDGVEVEHPNEIKTQRSYVLPAGSYYVGDPMRALSNIDDFFEDFMGAHECNEFFIYRDNQIVSVRTGSDGYFPLCKNDGNHEAGQASHRPIQINKLPVDLATISFIPLSLLDSLNISPKEIKNNGFIFEAEAHADHPDDAVLTVTIHDKGGVTQFVEFLQYIILIGDALRFNE